MLKPIEPFANQHDNYGSEYKEPHDKEEPEKQLDIMPEVTAIILLVAVHGFLTGSVSTSVSEAL